MQQLLPAPPRCCSNLCHAGLDSYQFPIKAFGDIGFRVYGTWCRYLFNILQAVQLICNVGAIIISNGEALSEAAKFKLCYAICCLVWALAGFILGQIRTLQKFGWLANVAVFINLTIMFITMGAAAHSPPLYSAAQQSAGASISSTLITPVNGKYPPVQHSNGLPSSGSFAGTLNGAMQAVYSYGGSMIFPEFMAEMRRPRDFLKGMWGAQIFIYICYMLYGLFIYGYQGKVPETEDQTSKLLMEKIKVNTYKRQHISGSRHTACRQLGTRWPSSVLSSRLHFMATSALKVSDSSTILS